MNILFNPNAFAVAIGADASVHITSHQSSEIQFDVDLDVVLPLAAAPETRIGWRELLQALACRLCGLNAAVCKSGATTWTKSAYSTGTIGFFDLQYGDGAFGFNIHFPNQVLTLLTSAIEGPWRSIPPSQIGTVDSLIRALLLDLQELCRILSTSETLRCPQDTAGTLAMFSRTRKPVYPLTDAFGDFQYLTAFGLVGRSVNDGISLWYFAANDDYMQDNPASSLCGWLGDTSGVLGDFWTAAKARPFAFSYTFGYPPSWTINGEDICQERVREQTAHYCDIAFIPIAFAANMDDVQRAITMASHLSVALNLSRDAIVDAVSAAAASIKGPNEVSNSQIEETLSDRLPSGGAASAANIEAAVAAVCGNSGISITQAVDVLRGDSATDLTQIADAISSIPTPNLSEMARNIKGNDSAILALLLCVYGRVCGKKALDDALGVVQSIRYTATGAPSENQPMPAADCSPLTVFFEAITSGGVLKADVGA